MKKLALAAPAALAVVAAAPASAALVITIDQVGADLIATGSGSINTTGLVAGSSTGYATIIQASTAPSSSARRTTPSFTGTRSRSAPRSASMARRAS